MNAILIFAMLLMGGMAFAQFNISKLLQEEDRNSSSVLQNGLTYDSFVLQQGGGNGSDVTHSAASNDSDTFQKGDGGLSVTDQVGTSNFSLVNQSYNYCEWGTPNRSYINHPETANQSSVNQSHTIFSDFTYSFVSQFGFLQMVEGNRAGLISTRLVIQRGNNYGSLVNQQSNNCNSIVMQST